VCVTIYLSISDCCTCTTTDPIAHTGLLLASLYGEGPLCLDIERAIAQAQRGDKWVPSHQIVKTGAWGGVTWGEDGVEWRRLAYSQDDLYSLYPPTN